MRKTGTANRLLAAVLTLALLLSLALPTGAAAAADVVHPAFTQVDSSEVSASLPGMEATELEPSAYSDTDSVRVSIVLEEKSTVAAGFSTQAIGSNTAAATYRGRLETRQAAVTAAIEEQALDGEALDVVWNLTLAANIISANVPYGKVEEIAKIPGVQDVVLETQYSAPGGGRLPQHGRLLPDERGQSGLAAGLHRRRHPDCRHRHRPDAGP